MKTSNRLILITFSMLFLGIVVTSMVLKSEFEKIDRNDPYYGFNRESLAPFKVLNLQGDYLWQVQVKRGQDYRILTRPGQQDIEWRIEGDTLFIKSGAKRPENFRQGSGPSIGFYLEAPSLQAINSEGFSSRIVGFNQKEFKVNLTGFGKLFFAGNTFSELDLEISNYGFIELLEENKLEFLNARVLNSSSLFMETNADSVNLAVDDSARVKLHGEILNRLLP